MRSKAARGMIAIAALLSLVLGCVLPGTLAYPCGMTGFLLLPQLLGRGVRRVGPDHGPRYATGPVRAQDIEGAARYLGAFAIFAFAMSAHGSDSVARVVAALLALLIAHGCALISALALLVEVFRLVDHAPGVTLEATTLMIEGADGTKVLSYADLRAIELDERRIWLVTSTGRHVIEVHGASERAQELARVIGEAKASAAAAAAQSARAPFKELRRPPGMSAREWLDRVDALAAASRSPGAYRRSAIDEEQLWKVLSDAGAHVDVRAAAARLLASSEDPLQRVRVDTLVNDIADEGARVRVALAMKTDTDAAAAELDALEMKELRKDAGV